jgi:hypothetical protein
MQINLWVRQRFQKLTTAGLAKTMRASTVVTSKKKGRALLSTLPRKG